jgi:hypothetical protein
VSVLRDFALAVLVVAACSTLACGDLEADRVCLNPPCSVPGRASAACQAYVSCFYRTSGSPGILDSTYGNGGVCWTSTPAASDACTQACKSAISSLISAFPDAGCSAR